MTKINEIRFENMDAQVKLIFTIEELLALDFSTNTLAEFHYNFTNSSDFDLVVRYNKVMERMAMNVSIDKIEKSNLNEMIALRNEIQLRNEAKQLPKFN